MNTERARKGRRSSWSRLLGCLFLVLFVAGGLYSGFIFYNTVKDIVAYAQFPSFADFTLPAVSAQEEPQESFLPKLEKKERVNILLLGIDQRPGERAARTDTIIIATIDPQTNTAGMLSIPRDLRVNIPTVGEKRINTAYFYGEINNYPGGGPALAMRTIQQNFGIPIHYYVLVNFQGFKAVVDTIGGIDVYVEEDINDPKYPDQNYGYDPFYITKGWHHMDGETALKYARTRATPGGDFDRLKRTQQVIMAVRDRVMQTDLLIQFIPQIPHLMRTLGDAIQTDMPVDMVIQLAEMAKDIDRDHIRAEVISGDMTIPTTLPSGAQVLCPVMEKIRPLVREMFLSPVQLDEAQIEDLNRLAAENARIMVQNGTPTGNLAARTSAYLKEQGFHVVQFGNADRFDYARTVIIYYAEKPYTVARLAQVFNVPQEAIQNATSQQSPVDIRVIIGADFKLPEGNQ